MRAVTKTEQFQVYDDVFAPDQFQALWRYVQLETYSSVHAPSWNKVWRILDGTPLGGCQVASGPLKEADAGKTSLYPTRSSLDLLFALLLERAPEFADVVGTRDRDWSVVTAKPFLYPIGSGLSWHNDSAYSGSYIFYAHPTWNCQWGGELLVAHPSCRDQQPAGPEVSVVEWEDGLPKSVKKVPIGQHLDNAAQNAVLGEPGIGQFILPKPNRPVLLRGGHSHKINPVSPSAGDRVRCSIAGFFTS